MTTTPTARAIALSLALLVNLALLAVLDGLAEDAIFMQSAQTAQSAVLSNEV